MDRYLPRRGDRRALLLAAAIAAAASTGAALSQARWETYANPRFGATADYPSDLFSSKEPPPENGDGQKFQTVDGRAELIIYGGYNVDNDKPDAYVENNVDLDGVTYKKIASKFYAVSGERAGTIFYERCNFVDPDILNCVHISYPAAEKAAWDKIVTRISASLRHNRVYSKP